VVAISRLDPETDEVAAFEELIGSHGGLGGPQTSPFILHPTEWTIDEPMIGAEAVYRQLRAWLRDIGIELGPPKAAPSGRRPEPGVGKPDRTEGESSMTVRSTSDGGDEEPGDSGDRH
jgi:hypothetical protein